MAVVDPKYISCRNGSCCVRSVELSDAPGLIALARRMSLETSYVTRQPHEVTTTVEEQTARIAEHIAGPLHLQLVATVNDEVYRHQGEFGVGLLQDYWGQRIGTELVSTLCSWADFVGIVKLTLIVDAENLRAVRLYERFGFVVEGTLRKDSRHGEVYRDALLMARFADSRLTAPRKSGA